MVFKLESLFNLNVFFSGTYPSVIEENPPEKKARSTFPKKFRDTLMSRQRKDEFSDCSCRITPGDFPVLAVIKDYVSENEAPAYKTLFFRDKNNPGRFSFPFNIPNVKNIYYVGYRDRVEIISADPFPKDQSSSTE